MVKLTQKVISKAVSKGMDALLEHVKNNPMKVDSSGTWADNARFGTVVYDGKDYIVNTQQWPCHRSMEWFGTNSSGNGTPVVVFNQFGHRQKINKDGLRAFFDFITSDTGPWREFVGRNISHVPEGVSDVHEWIFQNGWVWADLDNHPSNLQHSFLTAARMAQEWPPLIDKWYDWVQKGCHPALAFVFLDVFKPLSTKSDNEWGYYGADILEDKWQINHVNRYDWPFDVCSATSQYVRNVMNGKVESLNPSYRKSSEYRPVNLIFGKSDLKIIEPGTYPIEIFDLYAKEYSTEEDCKAYWDKRGTGFDKFDYKKHWFITEDQVIDIIKKEEVRLNGTNSSAENTTGTVTKGRRRKTGNSIKIEG